MTVQLTRQSSRRAIAALVALALAFGAAAATAPTAEAGPKSAPSEGSSQPEN